MKPELVDGKKVSRHWVTEKIALVEMENLGRDRAAERRQ
jgi:hypothetical protein